MSLQVYLIGGGVVVVALALITGGSIFAVSAASGFNSAATIAPRVADAFLASQEGRTARAEARLKAATELGNQALTTSGNVVTDPGVQQTTAALGNAAVNGLLGAINIRDAGKTARSANRPKTFGQFFK